MAIQERNGSYRVIFRHNGKQHSFTLGEVARDEAEGKSAQVDYLLMRLKQKLLILPEGTDIVTFVRYDGKPPEGTLTLPESPRKEVTFGQLQERYLATVGNGSLEANTIATCRMHLNHLRRYFGEAMPITDVTATKLQDYINARAKTDISAVTIKKEITTFRSAWNWGEPMELTQGVFPSKGLRYPKVDEKPPFMTMAEIEQQIAGGASEELWDTLYLLLPEIEEMLKTVKERATYDFIYPMFVFIAHTGARRSEVIRAQRSDVDFKSDSIVIREKKRAKGQRTTRRVPLTPLLKTALQDWLKIHPGGPHLFCISGNVKRSRTRSVMTGYKGDKTRATNLKGRTAGLKRRATLPTNAPLTRTEFHDHFKRTLKGTKWSVLKGAHALRHSFISNLAMKGIDQRMIDEFAGHASIEQQKRYRHLAPSTKAEALKSVFG